MKPTLVILAAGIASRYGSMKQTDAFGPSGETIIDYSIYDAIKAGFGKVTFIIRQEFEASFKAIFEPKLQGRIETNYVFQSYDLRPFGIDKTIERHKPWGTAHAVLAARQQIQEPFCVINADDYYGFEAFKKMADFLTSEVTDRHYALMGYEVDKTLSEHGSVSRGICRVDTEGYLEEINERAKVYSKDGQLVYETESGATVPLHAGARASMNFWGFTPAIFEQTEAMFKKFVAANDDNPKAEFLIPHAAEKLVKSETAQFKVLPTSNKWFGVTYKEDKAIVQRSLAELVENGTYPECLWPACTEN